MKKFLLIFVLLVISFIFGCAYAKEKAQVLFNKYKITPDTITSATNTNLFKPNERIYYLITLPKQVKSKMLFIQVLKLGGDKDERLGYDLVWGKRVKLRDEQYHYYTDYFVFNDTGAYVINVYSRDNPTKILTSANFYVKN